MYCEYCFDDNITKWVENSTGCIFCNKECMKKFEEEKKEAEEKEKNKIEQQLSL